MKVLRLVVSIIVVAVVLIFGSERLYFVNANSYPTWLATRDLGAYDMDNAIRFLLDTDCKGKNPVEAQKKSGGLYVFRCGGDLWFQGKTFIAHGPGTGSTEELRHEKK